MHFFEVLIYASVDLMIFQDISGVCLALSLESHTYFERAVLCAYLLLINENFCAFFCWPHIKCFWFALYFVSCLINNAWLKTVSIRGHSAFFSTCTLVLLDSFSR